MEKYRLIQEHKAEQEASLMQQQGGGAALSGDGGPMSGYPEVRITQQGKPRNYISYAMNLIADGSDTIVLKAMGRAINKAVTIAEILKRKISLHQWNSLASVEMIDVYEPVEEGLDIVTSRRYVSCMTITLSTTLLEINGMDTNHTGYQPPLPASELQPRDFHQQQQQQQQQQHLVSPTT